LNDNQTPYGFNVIVAIAACNGFNQEDAIILNKSAVERGMFKSSYHTTYTLKEVDSGSQTFKEDNDILIIHFDKAEFEIFNKKSDWDYSNLDENGIIRPNVPVFDNTVLVSAVTFRNGRYEDASLVIKAHDGDIVEKVFLSKDIPRTAKVQTYQTRFPIPGDKFASRAAQKATIGLMLKQTEMPYTADGVVPDLIFNPHSFPSRMTISYFLEMLSSFIAIEIGSLVEIPNYSGVEVFQLKTILDRITKRKHSEELKLYSGETGKVVSESCCIGPIFYQRLKQQAQDKAYSLGFDAPLDAITRQPLGGRAAGGGLKIGQMERDSLLSHGATSFLKEAFFEKADRFEMYVDSETGQIVPKFKYGVENHNAKKVRVPYAFKLLMQEIQSMNISLHLNVT
jgi:DNA-directed RNA polymerase II subunit RPB2